ncbi:hypothetical protein pb186bvf_014603 [Paramecium bursaria]
MIEVQQAYKKWIIFSRKSITIYESQLNRANYIMNTLSQSPELNPVRYYEPEEQLP